MRKPFTNASIPAKRPQDPAKVRAPRWLVALLVILGMLTWAQCSSGNWHYDENPSYYRNTQEP